MPTETATPVASDETISDTLVALTAGLHELGDSLRFLKVSAARIERADEEIDEALAAGLELIGERALALAPVVKATTADHGLRRSAVRYKTRMRAKVAAADAAAEIAEALGEIR